MSMNLFFRAFTREEILKMHSDHALIDQWVEEEKYSLETDIETAWDVLANILDGQGIHVGEDVDDALFNGCSLISADEVKDQAKKLSAWTKDQVVENLKALDADSGLYHIESFLGDENYLLDQFDALVAFYNEAAAKGLGAVSYVA